MAPRPIRDIRGMRHHDDGSAIPMQVFKQRQNLVACLAIERPGGLVCQNQGRIVDNGTSDGDALLLAPRKLMGPMMLAMPQSDPVKGIVGSAMPFRSANACISE